MGRRIFRCKSFMTEIYPLLELRSISKNFPGDRALGGVSLSLEAGEVLGVVGENGAGKRTLLKIPGGLFHPDGGEIWVGRELRRLSGPGAASSLGIQLIPQDLNLANDL